jgi:drug/metabolite transporter (DMT)-like permease
MIGFFGIITVCAGIFLIARDKINQFNTKAFVLACMTALLIAFYTLIDGMGVRGTENKFSYIFWLLLLNGIPVLGYTLFNKRKIFKNMTTKEINKGLAAGILAILSYGIVVWAMKYIEIAYVSSIRETSIIIVTLIGLFFLREENAKKRIMPAILVMCGITILYFQI